MRKKKIDKETEKKGTERRLTVPTSVSRFQESSEESQKKKIKKEYRENKMERKNFISCPVREYGKNKR
jgi:hypothetical protein